MEKKQRDVIVATKAQESEVPQDAEKRAQAQGHPTPQAAGDEVGGRSGMELVECPWDYAINYVYVDPYEWIWYRCWSCGNWFKV